MTRSVNAAVLNLVSSHRGAPLVTPPTRFARPKSVFDYSTELFFGLSIIDQSVKGEWLPIDEPRNDNS